MHRAKPFSDALYVAPHASHRGFSSGERFGAQVVVRDGSHAPKPAPDRLGLPALVAGKQVPRPDVVAGKCRRRVERLRERRIDLRGRKGGEKRARVRPKFGIAVVVAAASASMLVSGDPSSSYVSPVRSTP
jgi:hypothetical protein